MLSKTISKCIFLFLAIAISSLVFAQNVCQYVAGAKVVAEDGKYLGTIESKYSSDSIFNEYGTYGSKYSGDSIWNEYGSYGGKYSSSSPFNDYTSSAPMIINNNQVIARLTTNRYLQNAVNPYALKNCTFY
ncbi:hypothetical protein C2756_10915 [Polynucleobacter sp. UB-Siik-W21]|jgi:hypothetical protein|nr:hypothetical protein C2756_10915 [Polynucleobacter sp. UB-Siik-W21]